jgi:hypothetical protein
MSAGKTLNSAKQVLLGELLKYADIVASQRPASTPSKVARRQLAEIYAAIQAIELGERALTQGTMRDEQSLRRAFP